MLNASRALESAGRSGQGLEGRPARLASLDSGRRSGRRRWCGRETDMADGGMPEEFMAEFMEWI